MTHARAHRHREHVPRRSSDHHTAVERAPPPHTSIIKVTAKVTAVVTESLIFQMNTIKTRLSLMENLHRFTDSSTFPGICQSHY